MKTASAKQIESVLADRFGACFDRPAKHYTETLPTGVGEIDRLLNGFPRGGITEIHGAASAGRITLMLSALAFATSEKETCAVIDCSDTFDPSSAAKAGIDLDSLLWIRCRNNLEHAFKATDLLLQSGGFGLVALMLTDVPSRNVRRIISSWWFRFRRALENTSTALMVISPVPCIRSCAALVMELMNDRTVWSSAGPYSAKRDDSTAARQQLHLSLVRTSNDQGRTGAALLSHAHLFEKMCVRMNRQRPIAWTDHAVRFESLRQHFSS